MPRRRRSFFFDNINKRLLVDTFKNARTSKAEIDAGTVTAEDILKKSQIDSDVDASLANLVNTAPATLDTLDELAAALGDDANFATTTSTALGNRLRIDVNNQGLNATQLSNARTNLGLGTAATTASTDYATAAQGAKADTAHGWGNHANAGYGTSNFSGAYADLTGKPSLFSGSYNDLSNKPTIPTNNNQLTNGAGYITSETFAVRGTMSNADASQASGVYRINTGVTSQPGGSVTDYGTVVHFNNVSDTGFQIACDYNSASFYFRGGNSSTFGGSGTNQAWSKVWCDNNDGSGSGLDADTVDGIQASSLVGTHNGHNRNIDAEVGGIHFYADGGNSGRATSSYPYALFQESGAWSHPYPDLRINYHTGITLAANSGYEGIRFKTDYNSSTVVLQINGASSYSYKTTWLNTNSGTGMYSTTNNAHIWPNPGSYGSWKVRGVRNGWAGIEFDDQSESTTTSLMMNNDAYGFHKNGTGWRFYVTGGSGHFPGNVVAYWSDQRLKENIAQLPSGKGLDTILQLKPSSFNWKEDAKKVTLGCVDPSISEVSLIAQEAQAVNPQFVSSNKTVAKGTVDGEEITDILTINYDKITPYLVQAIKDLNEKVEKLQGIIDGLTS